LSNEARAARPTVAHRKPQPPDVNRSEIHTRRRELRLATFPALRIQISTRRFRIPDICVVTLPEPDEQIFTQPPYICIEIPSPDDIALEKNAIDIITIGMIGRRQVFLQADQRGRAHEASVSTPP
jgi:Uma2 family endonuclease